MSRARSHSREQDILTLWERGIGLSRFARDDAMLANDTPPPAGLGRRNAALLTLRTSLFDGHWSLRSRCPTCGQDCEFACDSQVLADQIGALPAAAETHFDWNGRSISLRPPEIDDLQAVSNESDLGRAARALLLRCASDGLAIEEVDEPALLELGDRLEQLDPGAVLSFALDCPSCRHGWAAVVDVGDAVWTELQRAAEGLLLQVDGLARAYGWTEGEIMRLSPLRRAAYLQMAAGS